jgi:hypothetical protein
LRDSLSPNFDARCCPSVAACRRLSSDSPTAAGRTGGHLGEAKPGGEYRARTGDLLVANQALSQLS